MSTFNAESRKKKQLQHASLCEEEEQEAEKEEKEEEEEESSSVKPNIVHSLGLFNAATPGEGASLLSF